MVNKIEILEIKCNWWPFNNFFWKISEKKISVFYGYNWAWKTLLFTTLNDMISWWCIVPYMTDNIKDFEANVVAKINDKVINYHKDISWLSIVIDWEYISQENYRNFIKEQLNIDQNLTNYVFWKKKKKNTISSTLRYNFVSDNDIKKPPKWFLKNIPLISTRFDFETKKPLLWYFLWVNLSDQQFQDFCELCKMENFVDSQKNEYEKWTKFSTLFDDKKEQGLYEEYVSKKHELANIRYTITQINNILNMGLNISKELDIKKDIEFLNQQLYYFKEIEKECLNEKQDIKLKLERNDRWQKDLLLRNEEKDEKSVVNFVNTYKSYKDKIPVLEKKLSTITNKYNTIFAELYSFLSNQFKKYDIYPNNYPYLNVNEQIFELNSAVSEWQIILIRILWMIFVNIFSCNKWWRIPNILFFDSISEKITSSSSYLYSAMDKIIEEFQDEFPQIFLFISGEEDKYSLTKLNNFDVNILPHSKN